MIRRGFTLIELLVAVAIIAILAAIAVPNFLAAQTRSKVSRAKADLSTIRTALESYAVDQGSYPLLAGGIGLSGALRTLTRPRQYISDVPKDVFLEDSTYHYLAPGKLPVLRKEGWGDWILASAGPDREIQTNFTGGLVYDPTNGTVSPGDIIFTQFSAEETQVAAAK